MRDKVLEAKSILERFSLKGKHSLVTGGGQGIGRAIAHGLADAGASVAIVDIELGRAEEVASELKEKGVDSMALRADVTKRDDIHSALSVIEESWGDLTIAVNNAGICIWDDAESLPDENWDKVMDLNLRGLFICCQLEGWMMIEKGYGKIINIASISGHVVNVPQHQVSYNASKAAVIHLSRSLAVEWAPKGVRVNSISPGYTRTKLVAELLKDPGIKNEMMPIWLGMTPMGRMVEVTDLQGAAVFLASEASDFMTGQDLIIDGGYCCQ
ncbi:MAG: glucose 1-dehydrogenase [Promethearchaeota archaeon]